MVRIPRHLTDPSYAMSAKPRKCRSCGARVDDQPAHYNYCEDCYAGGDRGFRDAYYNAHPEEFK